MTKTELQIELKNIEIEIEKAVKLINTNTQANEKNKIYLNQQIGKRELITKWLSNMEVNETK